MGPEFLGIGDETRFFAEASYVISGISFEETIDINRYTGSYENTFSTPKGGGCGILELAHQHRKDFDVVFLHLTSSHPASR